MKIEDIIKNSGMKCDNYSCGHRGEELEMCYFDVYPLCQYYQEFKREKSKKDNQLNYLNKHRRE